MRILIVSATELEIVSLKKKFSKNEKFKEIEFCITGVGIVQTMFELTRLLTLSKNYDLIINLGIAGSIDRKIELGEVVNVSTDSFYGWGAEDNDDFISIFNLGFLNENSFPFSNGKLITNYNQNLLLKNVEGITVQKVHGNKDSIESLVKNSNAQIETMEGACVIYIAHKFNLKVIQLRAISNYVEARNKENWNIKLAINNLNKTAGLFIKKLIQNSK
jgi:futalosine hydrolase